MIKKKFTGFTDKDGTKIYVGQRVRIRANGVMRGNMSWSGNGYEGNIEEHGEGEDRYKIVNKKDGLITQGSLAWECSSERKQFIQVVPAQKIIITRGLSGSGKSTWSKKYVREHPEFVRIGRDDLRFMLVDGWMVHDDRAVFCSRDILIMHLLDQGFNLVLDETFLAPHRKSELLIVLENWVYLSGQHLDIKIQDFIDTPLETCIERDRPRGLNEHVGEAFIRDYYEKYILPLRKNRGMVEWTI